MMNLNQTDFVDTMSTKSDSGLSKVESSHRTWNTSPPKNSSVNQEIIIEERILKEMAKIIHIEIIKLKNAPSHTKE